MSSIKKNILPIFLFLLTFLIYVHNLSRSVYGGDTGDFIAAATTMGVAHPPGYPLYTFLGFLFTKLNVLTPAFMVGLVSSIASSLSVVIFYLISLKLTKNKIASFIASLVLAFNFLFWIYAEIAEVFSLNVFFALLLIFLAILYSQGKKIKYLYALSLCAGLSLTNHQTIVLIFPSIFIIIFSNILNLIKSYKKSYKTLFYCLIFFVLGLSVYLYIFVSNINNPKVNWVPVNDISSFLRLFLRSDYGTFNAGPFIPGTLMERLTVVKIYFGDIVSQITFPTVALIVLGFISFFRKNKKLFTAILLGFVLSGPLFIGYSAFPLLNAFFISVYERFIVLSSVILLLFLPFGLIFFSKLPEKILKKRTYEKVFILIFLIIPISLFYYNFPKTNLSKITVGDDFAYDYLTFLPKNTFLVMGGDTPLLNVWYVHYALDFRKDVTVVNVNQLVNDKNYLNEREVYLAKNPNDSKNPNLKLKVFEQIAQNRPLYVFDPIRPAGKFDKITWVPYGLVSRLYLPEDTLPTKEEYLKQTSFIWDNLRYFKNLKNERGQLGIGNAGISDIPSQYANSLLLTGNYVLGQYEDGETAVSFFNSAIKTSPSYYRNYQILGVYQLSQKKCIEARDSLEKAISIYPFDKDIYYFLYSDYAGCIKDKAKADKIITDYKKLFKTDFIKDIQDELKNG